MVASSAALALWLTRHDAVVQALFHSEFLSDQEVFSLYACCWRDFREHMDGASMSSHTSRDEAVGEDEDVASLRHEVEVLKAEMASVREQLQALQCTLATVISSSSVLPNSPSPTSTMTHSMEDEAANVYETLQIRSSFDTYGADLEPEASCARTLFAVIGAGSGSGIWCPVVVHFGTASVAREVVGGLLGGLLDWLSEWLGAWVLWSECACG